MSLKKYFPKFVLDLYKKYWLWKIKNNPKAHAASEFRIFWGRELNWDNPTILSEKGRWVQFNTDTSEWSLYADKYRVREYLEGLGLSEYLPKLYGVWEKASDIDFNSLPSSFVIKTNHGCGEVIVVKNKSKADLEEIRAKMQHYLQERYGVQTAEPHYLNIKPVVLAEEVLPATCPDTDAIVDYKIFCNYGKPIFLDITYNRNMETHHAHEAWYDPEWNKHDEWHTGGYKVKDITRPTSLEKMYEICAQLGKDWPLARIDFYDVNGRPYIGELTFTPNGYTPEDLTPEAQLLIGNMIKLHKD